MKNLLRSILEEYNLYLPARTVFEKFKYTVISLRTGLARLIPPFSKSTLKGYYSSSRNYWQICQKNNIVIIKTLLLTST
jgi:hypothetical protein